MTGGVMVATGSTVQLVVQQVLFGASLADASALVPLHMAFALFLATVFRAGAHTIRLIGVGQFLSVLAGRYRRPVHPADHAALLGIMQCAAWAALLRAERDDERVTERTLCSGSARSTSISDGLRYFGWQIPIVSSVTGQGPRRCVCMRC